LGKCYAREGVNHLEKCGKLRGMFHFLFFFLAVSLLVPSLLGFSAILHYTGCPGSFI